MYIIKTWQQKMSTGEVRSQKIRSIEIDGEHAYPSECLDGRQEVSVAFITSKRLTFLRKRLAFYLAFACTALGSLSLHLVAT